ncbi:hypothetical protein AB0L00_20260 [Actinoallomurus sp. NPDC052308]|uniref:hypothetical protein n=1 Tax=Actinoallomurus sp. NPDC052308 TaxID=3155530 RepID=UPI0034466629
MTVHLARFKRTAVLGLAAAAALIGPAAVCAPADAGSTPEAICGSGYHEIDHHNLNNVVTFYLMYNGSTDCQVAWKTANVGTPTEVATIIE